MSIVSETIVLLDHTLSSASTAVNGPQRRSAGQAFDVQIMIAPGSFVNIEVSQDGVIWAAATDADGNTLSNIGAGVRVVRERLEFVRGTISTDASAPRAYYVVAVVAKDS